MLIPQFPDNEQGRLSALKAYSIYGTMEEKDFDDITRLAAEICGVPIAMVTLVGDENLWIKSSFGLPVGESPRNESFCAHALNKPAELFVVNDATKDARFDDNPNVTGSPNVVFYTGVPLVTPDGFAMGTLCVLDRKQRELSTSQQQTLQVLAKQVMNLLELRRKNIELDKKNKALNQFAYVLSHDIKAPVANIYLIAHNMREDYTGRLDADGDVYLNYLEQSAEQIKKLVNDVLAYYREDNEREFEDVDVNEILRGVTALLDARSVVQFTLPENNPIVYGSKIALQQIFINLINNALKYNDKPTVAISIEFTENEEFYFFSVKDNGRGIAQKNLDRIFELFTHLKTTDRDGKTGTGIGLATVKKLVEEYEGRVEVKSTEGVGTQFTFSIKKTARK